MIKVKRRSGLIISRENESYDFYQDIKNKLIRRQREFNTETWIVNMFYIESDAVLSIPRYFPIEDYVQCQIEDLSHEGDSIDISHSIEPRDELQKQAIEYMMNNDWGTIQLKPGVGKTIISILVVAERKRKTIVLVHRDSLVQQWKERFHQFTTLKADEVSVLSSATFLDDLTKPIIISTAQTFKSLLKRKRKDFLIALNKANIGIMIGDEVHTSIGAPSFSECSIHIPAKVTFGLSATPSRADGNEDIIFNHCGPLWAQDDASGTMDAKVTVFLFDYGIDIPYRHKYLYWEGKFQRSRYLNLIKNSKLFQSVAEGLMNKLIKDDRDIIFVCERIKLINQMMEKVVHPESVAFIAGVKNEVLSKRIVYSTPGKVRDGVDIPHKDCLLMTSPIKNIEQICGRVTRSNEGKEMPIIMDMIDFGCVPIAKTFYGRRSYYFERGWKINYVLISQGKMNPIEEDVALDIIDGR